MPSYPVKIDNEVLERIAVAETMHNFVLESVPQRFLTDTDQKTIVVALFSLVVEHHGAILTLLKLGRFDGSAFALGQASDRCSLSGILGALLCEARTSRCHPQR